jgi:hypothetical protein
VNKMNQISDVGQLLHLYVDEILPEANVCFPEFLVQSSASLLSQGNQRNWVPLIVKQVQSKQYQVIGNSLVYAVAEAAGLERIWCILADDTPETEALSRALSGETTPKVNLSNASYHQIHSALKHLLSLPDSPLKTVNLPVATNRIDEAPRQYWKDLSPIIQLKCGITKGKKLEFLSQIFYLTPQPLSSDISDTVTLKTLNTTELKAMAKARGITGYAKLKKADLVSQLSQSS